MSYVTNPITEWGAEDIDALDVIVTPAGNLASDNVQAALEELQWDIDGLSWALKYKGTIDCSANPNYPAAVVGDTYIVSVNGKIGWASGSDVEQLDMIICKTASASGNQATVGANWSIVDSHDLLSLQELGTLINSATAKATPVDTDMVGLMDSAAGNIIKKLSWANIKATLKTYFDTLYQAAGSYLGTGGGTLTGNVTLAENVGIVLDASLSADGTYSGIVEAGTAWAALAFWDLVYLAVADSRWELTDADAAATAGPVKLWICVLAAASDGDPTTILLFGKVRADSKFPTLTIGAPAYVSTTAGAVQVAQPSGTDDVVRVVWYANTADELFFNPSQDFITLV